MSLTPPATVHDDGEHVIIKLNAPKILDESTIHEIGNIFKDAVSDNPDRTKFIIDCSIVTFMSSAMIGKILYIHMQVRKTKSGEGRISMCAVRPNVWEVFKITRMMVWMERHKDLAEAIQGLAKPRPEHLAPMP